MGTGTKISWADHTFNPWRGCTEAENSPACDHCYARTMAKRNPATLGVWGKGGTRPIAAESYWQLPKRWNAAAARERVRRRVFCLSLGDFFEGPDTMPAAARDHVAAARERTFDLITDTPWLDWLLVTKRPENIRPFWRGGYRKNVWRLVTVENQEQADRRIPALLTTNDLSPIAGLSMEPLLGPVDLLRFPRPGESWSYLTGERKTVRGRTNTGGIDWVIVGGESGVQARPMHLDWVQSVRNQCMDTGTAFYFKQWGAWVGGFGDPRGYLSLQNGTSPAGNAKTHVWGGGVVSERVGVAAAGRMIGGKIWDELPTKELP